MTGYRIAWLIAAALWLVSLVLPAALIGESTIVRGYQAFALGIDALSAGILGWCANPLALLAVILGFLQRYRLSTAAAALACIAAFSSFGAPEAVRADGVPLTDVAFKAGFFLWLGAFSLILAASLLAAVRQRSR